jgi:pimeloyl-ACP methyl ester carboxylesterase
MVTVANSADGVAVAYDDLGSGEPALLLLTGWCSNRDRWAPVVQILSRQRRVVSFEWRGHGASAPAPSDFGVDEMLADALAVVEASGVDTFVPCAASHSGWVAIELYRRMPERVPMLVHADWMVLEPPGPYMDVIRMLESNETWPAARDKLFEIWQADVESPEVREALDAMNVHDEDMWMRSGRVIEGSYVDHGSPLRYLSELDSPPPVLHIYGQPRSQEYLAAQQAFAAEHDWFHVEQINAHSHFSMIETPDEVAGAIQRFVER